MKKKVIMIAALAFGMAAFSAFGGAKTEVAAYEYQQNVKTVYPVDSYVLLGQKDVVEGSTYTFSVDPEEYEEDAYDDDMDEYGICSNLTWSVEGDAISLVSQADDNMSLTIRAESLGEATVSVTYDIEFSTYIRRCTSTSYVKVIEKPEYSETSDVLENQSIAKGKTKTLSIAEVSETDRETYETVTPTNVSWSLSGESVRAVSTNNTNASFKVKAAAEGQATVSVTYDMVFATYIYHYTSTATIYVSNPKLSAKTIGINKYCTTYGSIEIAGCSEYSSVTCTPSSKKVTAYAYENWWSDSGDTWELYVEASKKGTYTVALDIDGKSFTVTVNVFSAYFKCKASHSSDTYMDKKWHEGSTTLALYKNETEQLTVKGLSSDTKIKWKSSNKKVATVNQSGLVRAKGNGSCTITASFSGGSITYAVGVASTTAVKAVYYAIKHFGSTYSQAERMAEGKYDCSSYIYRAYKAAGKTLGTDSTWAPTAASLAQWCAQKGYVLYTETETVDMSKLRPGDLIFWTGEDNGRYKGIYHVDLYTGNYSSLTVERTKGYGDTLTGVIIARPCK